MNLLRGIRPSDWVLTAGMAALAATIAYANVHAGPGNAVAHPLDSHSPLMDPVFVAAALPILLRRRAIVAAIVVSALVIAVSLPMFGWVTRCGFALPLAVAMAYAVARFAGSRRHQIVGLAAIVALQVVTLVWDSSTGGLSGLSVGLPAAAVAYGVGLFVQSRSGARAAQPTLSAERVPV